MCLAGRPLRCQQVAWRVPTAGAVEYRRTGQAMASVVCKSRRLAKVAEVGSALPARYLQKLPPAPFLCQGELREDRRSLDVAVADLRDVLRFLAFDLSSTSVRSCFPRVLPYGDVVVSGNWSPMQASGCQQLEARFQAKIPASLRREPRILAKRLAAFCVPSIAGSVLLTRAIDRERGLVTGFRGAFDLVASEGERRFRRIKIEEEWQLLALRENQDLDFRRRVSAAIHDGVAFVRSAIDSDKAFFADKRGERNYGSGRLALALMTMIHGHVSADDRVLSRGFAALCARRLEDTYSLATALMAMAARHRFAPLSERDRLVCLKWLAKMMTCVDPRTKPAELLRFNYSRGARFDTSLQQFGLLGLCAAQEMGLEVPAHAFTAAVNQLLVVQAPAKESIVLQLVHHAQLRSSLGVDGPPASTRSKSRVRGFSYQGPDEPSFGSMTCAGISGLLLARAGLRAQAAGKHRGLHKRIDRAVEAGFAWIAKNFSVRLNPGFAERADNHWFYWLYCLERCCELRGVARVQDRDWYYEGGLQLLAAQNQNGSFRAGHSSTLQIDSTCFAILFLAKASAPAPTTGGR